MGRFDNIVKGVVVEVGSEKFTIKALNMEDFGLLQDWSEFVNETKGKKLSKEDVIKQVDLMRNLVYITLHYSDPTITMDDVKEIPLGHTMKLVETIMNINEFTK